MGDSVSVEEWQALGEQFRAPIEGRAAKLLTLLVGLKGLIKPDGSPVAEDAFKTIPQGTSMYAHHAPHFS